MSEETREGDFERESSRLSEGLKSCRAVMENYRAMMSADAHSDDESSDMSRYVSTTGSTAAGYQTDSSAN